MRTTPSTPRTLSRAQRTAATLMGVLVLLTFVGANLQALLWQSSEWLVSTILPAVVVDLTNAERADNALPPLRPNDTLAAAARLKAAHMAAEGYFAHYSPDGTSPWYWFDQVGYRYAHAGENLAVHFTDSAEMVTAWMNSPSHRENIVGPQYTEIGIGTATGTFQGYETVFVVQLFGAPAAPATDEPAARPSPPDTPTPPPPSASAPAAETASNLAAPPPAPLPVATTETTPAPPAPADTTSVAAVQATATAPTARESVAEARAKPVEPPVATERFVRTDGKAVRVETSLLATSSGLAVAQLRDAQPTGHAGGTLTALLTQPNALLQSIYSMLALLVVGLLGYSIVRETRRVHYWQVAYGCLLLVGMAGLWFVHLSLTSGAVIS